MRTYTVIATSEYQLPVNVISDSEWSSDDGMYTEVENAQTIRISVPKNMAGGFEQSMNTDRNVIEYAELD